MAKKKVEINGETHEFDSKKEMLIQLSQPILDDADGGTTNLRNTTMLQSCAWNRRNGMTKDCPLCGTEGYSKSYGCSECGYCDEYHAKRKKERQRQRDRRIRERR